MGIIIFNVEIIINVANYYFYSFINIIFYLRFSHFVFVHQRRSTKNQEQQGIFYIIYFIYKI